MKTAYSALLAYSVIQNSTAYIFGRAHYYSVRDKYGDCRNTLPVNFIAEQRRTVGGGRLAEIQPTRKVCRKCGLVGLVVRQSVEQPRRDIGNQAAAAEAMKAYAKQAQDKQLEIDASEIRIRAERRLGEMIKAQKETVGLATGGEHGGRAKIDGTRDAPSNTRPTLADAGISKKLSSRAQSIAIYAPAVMCVASTRAICIGGRSDDRHKPSNARPIPRCLHAEIVPS